MIPNKRPTDVALKGTKPYARLGQRLVLTRGIASYVAAKHPHCPVKVTSTTMLPEHPAAAGTPMTNKDWELVTAS